MVGARSGIGGGLLGVVGEFQTSSPKKKNLKILAQDLLHLLEVVKEQMTLTQFEFMGSDMKTQSVNRASYFLLGLFRF